MPLRPAGAGRDGSPVPGHRPRTCNNPRGIEPIPRGFSVCMLRGRPSISSERGRDESEDRSALRRRPHTVGKSDPAGVGAAGGRMRSQRRGRTRAKEGGRPSASMTEGRSIGGAKAHTPEEWRGRSARTPVRSEEASGAVARPGCPCPRSSREVRKRAHAAGAMLSARSCSGDRSGFLRAAFCRVRRTWRCGQRRDSPQAAAG